MGSPSYLVVWFSASAGQNGENLGSDEEEIVLVVYLLLDITNAKVVDLQQHYVKPRTADISETILTDECKEETGLQEEQIKHAQPLESVLEEFNRFLQSKGAHPELGGRSFIFCTDGDLHFRQCIHPETCNKGIILPRHFYRFFNLRREFQRIYRSQQQPVNIKDMLDYLGVAGDNTVEYGVRHANDMASIILRMIADGHEFDQPEVVNERLEPGICRRDDEVDDNTIVRARGLPWQASDQDIAKFFKGLNIAKGGVALCLSNQGRRNGEALIKLETTEQRDLALRRHKHHIGQRYIEVYRATGKDFIGVAGGANEDAHAFLKRGGEIIVRMRGLPFNATAKDVLEFFTRAECPPVVLHGEDGILFVKYHDGRATGDAFVLFPTEDDCGRALALHREVMGSRYIELFKSTTAEVQQVLNRSLDPTIKPPGEMNQNQQPLIAQIPLVPQQLITQGSVRDCIRLRGLPPEAQVTDILNFLGELSQTIVYQGVHMVYNSQGQPAGEAFIQMDSEKAATLATHNKNGRYLVSGNKKKFIEVLQCSGEDMHLVLTGTTLNGQLVQQPRQQIVSIAGNGAFVPTAAPAAYPVINPQLQQLPATMPAAVAPVVPQNLGAAVSQPLAASLAPALTQVAPVSTLAGRLGSYYPQMLYFYPSPPVSPQTAGLIPQQPAVLFMRGLPVNVSVQDILSFFNGFPEVSAESVQIQRTADGRCNGDALIVFVSRNEAERALTERNRNLIGHKLVELYMAA